MQIFQRIGMALLVLSLLGCFGKKKQPADLSSWLESNFSGQMQVVNNIVNLDLKNLYYKETNTIVADKNDPEVQIKVTWFKNQEGLGLKTEEIQTALNKSRGEVQAARTLFGLLHEKGLEKISVGVIDEAAYILIYTEPDPVTRKKYLEQILSSLNARNEKSQTSIWIEFMESSAYQKEFKDIIPFGYWQRGGSYHEDHKIMSLDFEWAQDLEINSLMAHWTINTASERSSQYIEYSYREALSWAEKNLSKPFYLEGDQMIEYALDQEDPLAIHYHFPYYKVKPDTTIAGYEDQKLGYVTGIYQSDQKSFSKIKRTKEL